MLGLSFSDVSFSFGPKKLGFSNQEAAYALNGGS